MNVSGTVELKCTTDKDPTSANIYCLVSSDLNDDMLISYKDFKESIQDFLIYVSTTATLFIMTAH